MKKTFLIVAALVSFTAFAFAEEISINIAPNVLNLQRTDDKCVTVHTDIAYSLVDPASVELKVKVGDDDESSISIYYSKPDDRGYFVAKFLMGEVKELPLTIDEYNTLTLAGETKEAADSFWGVQDILVVNNTVVNNPKDR